MYGEEAERFLSLLVWNLRGTADFLSRWKLNRQYMMLRILMCRFVFEGVLRGMREKHTGLQFLLEQTTEYTGRQNTFSKMQLVSDIRAATEELMRWAGERGFDLSGEKGKEWQARTLGYLYNVIWMCREKGFLVQRGLDQIAADEQITEKSFIYDARTKLTPGGQVDYWLNRILGYRVSAEEIPGTELIRVAYSSREIGRNIRPKNVGTGVSYIAEIIIAAFSCKRGDMPVIENPEIHLHPSGQSELVESLVFLAHKGLQVVMETHSDHIFNGLRRCVGRDRTAGENVRIYFFRQDEMFWISQR